MPMYFRITRVTIPRLAHFQLIPVRGLIIIPIPDPPQFQQMLELYFDKTWKIMKRYTFKISWLISFAILFSSCEDFLTEEPKTFLSPDFYFTSENQIKAAVNGVYTFLDDR